jgi:UDP-N-acetylmuramate dehydrogenase
MKQVELCYKDCHFSYRNSIFKSSQKGRYIITHVCFTLKKRAELNLGYGRLREAFEESGGASAADLRQLVIRTRRSKLPDHNIYGNAGSFFKNPLVPRSKLEELQDHHPDIPHYPEEENLVKIPAAWLIDQAGWKGKRKGDVGAWPTQPLVLVNYGKATGTEIYDFSQDILEDVQGKYGILLEREVNVL